MDILTGMRTYAAVVSLGSFTAAAERLGVSKALTSKYVQQLEMHLGARLLSRTTRKLNTTEVGQAYYLRCQQQTPQGELVISAPISFGETYLTNAVADYLEEQREVSIRLELSDRFVDIVDEGFDMALRIGEMQDSSLIARRLAPVRIIACATPEYPARAGVPKHPNDLTSHTCIVDTNFRTAANWHFQDDGQGFAVNVASRFRVNTAPAASSVVRVRNAGVQPLCGLSALSPSGGEGVFVHSILDKTRRRIATSPEWSE